MASTVHPFINPTVWVRRSWSDPWQPEPRLEALAASEAVGPELAQAEFLWPYGRRTLPGNYQFANYEPFDYNGWFVQVRAQIESRQTELFTGIFVEDELVQAGSLPVGNDLVPTGDQNYTAVDLSYLLDRVSLSQAVCRQDGKDVVIDWVPPMNIRHERGNSLLGNASGTVNGQGLYSYSTDGNLWTHRTYLERILHDQQPAGLAFQLAGQYQLLDHLITAQSLEGLTLRQVVDRLVDRRRGFGWKIARVGFGPAPVVPIVIYTVFDEPVTIGDVTYDPNPVTVDLVLANTPENQVINLKLSDTNRYDRIVCRGERIVSCFTITKTEFEKAWTDDEETNYKNAAKDVSGYSSLSEEEKAKENDRYRSDERFRRVYTTIRLPQSWDWKTKYYGDNWRVVNPVCDKDGNLTSRQGTYFNLARRFLRQLPLQEGIDYTGSVIQDHNPAGSEPEFLPPLVWIKADDGKYYPVDRLHESYKDSSGNPAPSMSVTVSSREFGLTVQARPHHLLGKNHYDPATAEPSATEPVFDWQDLIATVAVHTDQRLQVIAGDTQSTADVRELVIDVPDAQLWHIVPDTAIATAADGSLVPYGPADNILRNDKQKLQAIAAAALGWFGKVRQSLNISLAGLAGFAECGDLIKGLWDESTYQDINTVLTAIRWDFRQGITQLHTAYANLDFVRLADQATFAGVGGIRAVATELQRQAKLIRDLQTASANQTIRDGTGGGASGNISTGNIKFGKATADWTSGATITLDPCDIKGTDNGEANVTVYLKADKSSESITTATIGGSSTSVACKIAQNTIIPYQKDASGDYYIIGTKQQVMYDWKVDGTVQRLYMRVYYSWGYFASTVSIFKTVHIGTSC